jgi:putative oxidoreductase
MRAASLSPLGRQAAIAPVVLRVIAGAIMAAHGYQKLMGGPANFGNQVLEPLGVPFPVVVGYLQTFAELIGGILLVVGLLSRLAAAVLAVILVLAIFLVKLDLGLIAESGAPLPGAELDLALIGALIGVLVLGPGRPSVDHAAGLEKGSVA